MVQISRNNTVEGYKLNVEHRLQALASLKA